MNTRNTGYGVLDYVSMEITNQSRLEGGAHTRVRRGNRKVSVGVKAVGGRVKG